MDGRIQVGDVRRMMSPRIGVNIIEVTLSVILVVNLSLLVYTYVFVDSDASIMTIQT